MEGLITIQPYTNEFRDQIISVWEKSVRTTHDFVTSEDIDYFKSVVITIDFTLFEVFCAISVAGEVIGFIGVADHKVEMLFLDPEYIGKGIGKQLMEFALKNLNVSGVDVNEQNQNAVAFYEKFGFKTYDRTEKDPEGKDYPILKMRLEH